MDKDHCFELGYILRAHGLDGGVVARFDVDEPARYLGMDAVFLEISTGLVPHLIRSVKPMAGQQVVLHLEGISNDTAAHALKGCRLFLPEQALPKLDDGQFYFHELVGVKVADLQVGPLGTIREILDFPQQTLALMDWKGSEVLIPVHPDITLRLDRKSGTLFTQLPEGLIDVYLQEPKQDEVDAN
jgi:16S rRNA processing protein RimM